MPSSLRGNGISSYFNTLQMVPNALSSLRDQVQTSIYRGDEEINQRRQMNRQKRAQETAERKARQGMLTNMGIGVGGAALGAGVGSLLAAPAATAATAGTTTGINAAADAAVASGAGLTSAGANAAGASIANAALGGGATSGLGAGVGAGLGGAAIAAGPYTMSAALGDPNTNGLYQQGTITAPAPSMSDYRSAIPMDGTSVLGDPYQPPSAVPQTFMPSPPPPTSPSFGATIGNAPTGGSDYSKFFTPQAMSSYSPKPNQFGYLGNSRGQVFGNLFLQGLGGVVPGMAGVASGIGEARRMNYQMGRDAVSDAFQQERLGIAREGVDARKAYYNRPGALGNTIGPLEKDVRFLETLGYDPKVAAGFRSGMTAKPAVVNPMDAYRLELSTFGSNPALWSPEQMARAKAIGDTMSKYQQPSQPQLGGSQAPSPEIQRLESMRSSGEITPEEYEELKRRLMNR